MTGGRRKGWRQLLEDNLQAKLQVERFSGAESRCAVPVADRVGGKAEVTAIEIAWRRQIGAIKEVEHFDAELGADAFRDLRILHDGEVNGGIARAVVTVARAGSKCSGCGSLKRRRIYPRYAVLVECVRDTGKRIADLVCPLRSFPRAGRVRRRKHGERLPGAER